MEGWSEGSAHNHKIGKCIIVRGERLVVVRPKMRCWIRSTQEKVADGRHEEASLVGNDRRVSNAHHRETVKAYVQNRRGTSGCRGTFSS